MQKFKDVAHLYAAFDGQPDAYLELARSRDAKQSRERWPLISAIGEWTESTEVSPVHSAEPVPRAVAGLRSTLPPTIGELRKPVAAAAAVSVYEQPLRAAVFQRAQAESPMHDSPLAAFAQQAGTEHDTLQMGDLGSVFARLSAR